MDRLSVELIRIVCSFLDVYDVGNLRRASKFYANVGRPFMYRFLYLLFTPDSFERLLATSSNPEMAPHVTYLCYEADTLPAYEEMDDWEHNLSDPGVFSNLELMDPASSDSSSECADRAYERELSPLTELKSPRYHKFLNYRKQQDAMREDDYYAGKIVDAMSRLPNLETIIFSLEHWAGLPSQAIKNAYSDSLVVPYGHNSWKDPRGVPQMLSLLQGSAHNQIKLKVLHGGVMDWKFFKQSDEAFKDLQKAVRNVQELKLEFSTSPGMEEARDLLRNFHYEGRDELELEIRECAKYLKNGRLQEFLAAAPNLEILDLRFDSAIPSSIRGYPADLSYVVGMQKWEFLADVTLSFFSSRAEDLVGFCEIHAGTMQRLAISKIILVEGSWLSTFQKMRRLLHLKEVRIRGRLEAFNECWTFAMMETRGETTMSRVVQEYLLQGGDGPLLDLEQYTDLSKDELKELKDLRLFYDSAWH